MLNRIESIIYYNGQNYSVRVQKLGHYTDTTAALNICIHSAKRNEYHLVQKTKSKSVARAMQCPNYDKMPDADKARVFCNRRGLSKDYINNWKAMKPGEQRSLPREQDIIERAQIPQAQCEIFKSV